MIKLAIYGKGGIGKSTTASNVSAALGKEGLRVMQIGCDPKADSTGALSDAPILTVLDALRKFGSEVTLSQVVREGAFGVKCVEAGGPTPGVGCAGRGIITAFETLNRLSAFEVYRPDVVLYDVLGDVVCGGFAMPIRDGYARDVFIVTSGEKMSLYAAGNIALAIDQFKSRGYARLAGLILNARGVEDEEARVAKLADDLDTSIVGCVPRDGTVQRAELLGKTVVEAFPESALARRYTDLAHSMLERSGRQTDES